MSLKRQRLADIADVHGGRTIIGLIKMKTASINNNLCTYGRALNEALSENSQPELP